MQVFAQILFFLNILQVDGERIMIIGINSRRPKSIARERIILENAEKEAKLYIGPITSPPLPASTT